MSPTARTAVDTRVLEAIANYIATKGFSPSFRELGDAVGMASVAGVRYAVNRLKDQGLVDYDPRRPRTLRLTKQATA